MRLHAGASGFSYKEWVGGFYPTGTKSAAMLRTYAERLSAVEINATFYRMPKADVLTSWAAQVPPEFVFVLKASRRITHQGKLDESADSVAYLWKNAAALGAHLGPILYQLPPYSRRDDARLEGFLSSLPEGQRAVIEFRHRSWFDDAVFARLEERGVGLCFSDVDPSDADDPGLEQPFRPTAPFGYVRLRRASYDDQALREWVQRMQDTAATDMFVFFKHEPTAPDLALRLRALWE